MLTPRTDDSHQDHRLIAGLAKTTWRDSLILQYEIAKWDGDLRPVTHYVPLTDEQARRKVDLLHTCFASQRHRDWWDDEVFLGLMRLRGMETRARYAEGFLSDKVRLDLGTARVAPTPAGRARSAGRTGGCWCTGSLACRCTAAC